MELKSSTKRMSFVCLFLVFELLRYSRLQTQIASLFFKLKKIARHHFVRSCSRSKLLVSPTGRLPGQASATSLYQNGEVLLMVPKPPNIACMQRRFSPKAIFCATGLPWLAGNYCRSLDTYYTLSTPNVVG
jgi:hypothetical protein